MKAKQMIATAMTMVTVLGQSQISTVYAAVSKDAAVKFDKLTVKDIYEAEDAELLGSAGKNTDHTGYSGSGFVDGLGNVGSGLKFTVNAKEAGRYTLSVRYAVGTSADAATMNVYVNGTKTGFVGMAAMSSWDQWWTRNYTVELNQGENTITLKREADNGNAANIDYVTLEKADYSYIGACTGVEGSGTPELTFQCSNAAVKVKACADQIIKVWCEPSGKFYRRYDSFTVEDENISPVNLNVEDKGAYYEFSTEKLTVRVNKAQFSMIYLDKEGNVLCENQADSFGWNDENELIVNNKISDGEQFWGLGEKTESFNRTGEKLIMWSTDYLGAQADAGRAEEGNGCWYSSDPHYISSKGYAIYFDNTSRTQFDLGATDSNTCSFGTMNPAAEGELCYYFIGGDDMKDLTNSFTDLTGKSFFGPEWAYGNMQCHYGYTQDRILEVAETYREKQIPCDVLFSDIEWYQNQCSPTEWNHTNYPNPDAMLATIKNQGYRFGLIDDPNVSASTTSQDDYTVGVANNYFIRNTEGIIEQANWPWGGADGNAVSGMSGVTDFFNPYAAKWWGDLHNKVLNQGVEAFWLDMNEPARYQPNWAFYNQEGKSFGNIEELHNAYALMHQKAMYNKVSEDNSRPFLQTRSSFTGSHRYASPWTGDIRSDYDSMSQQLRLGLSLSMSGFNYWGFDIGGFYGNFTDDEYKRWVELSTFIPVHRFHYANWNEGDGNGQCYTTTGKEPWNFGCEEIARDQINLRYQLIPYMYSCTADSVIGTGLEGDGTKGTGIPLTRAMVMEYFDDENTYNLDTQFMCGPSLLVAPVVEAATTKEVYFPEGTWYDYSDGITTYTTGNITYNAPIDKLPLFVKEGAILPMMPVMQYVGEKPIDQLTLDVYPLVENGTSSFVYYEDDGTTQDYLNGEYATTTYNCTVNNSADQRSLTFTTGMRTGKYSNSVADRNYMIQIHKMAYEDTAVKVDGNALESLDSLEALNAATQGFFVDPTTQICYVKLHDDAGEHNITVTQSINALKESGEEEIGEATKVEITNGGFETATIDGWTVWSRDGKDAYGIDQNDVYEGSYKCYFYRDTEYAQSIHQEVTGLNDGTYKVTAWVKTSNKEPNTCRMELSKYDSIDESKSTHIDIPFNNTYTQYEGTVRVTSGKLDIGFYCDGKAYTSVQIDNVEMWKMP